MTTKKSAQLILADKLSRLTFINARKLLGPEGNHLIQQSGKWDIDIAAQVDFTSKWFRLTLPDDNTTVDISLAPYTRQRIQWQCSACKSACEHVGAAFSLILEEKIELGLAAAPPEQVPAESLSEQELVAQALSDHTERARNEKMRASSSDTSTPWADYMVSSAASDKTYRVALRGTEPGESFCSCPDFRKNTLGTCKHILHTLAKAKRVTDERGKILGYKRRYPQ